MIAKTQQLEAAFEPLLPADELRLLVEIGLLGAGHGAAVAALRLFAAVRLVAPEQVAGPAGMASTLLTLGRTDEALACLASIVESGQADPSIVALYGLALHLSGSHAQSREVLLPLVNDSNDAAASALARRLLESRNVMMGHG